LAGVAGGQAGGAEGGRPTSPWSTWGIGGNRVLRDVTGASALARFDRDVLSQPGVKWVMVLEDQRYRPWDP